MASSSIAPPPPYSNGYSLRPAGPVSTEWLKATLIGLALMAVTTTWWWYVMR